VCESFG